MQCPKCDFDVGNARFCSQCGTSFDASFRPNNKVVPMLIAGGVAVALIGVLFGTGVIQLGGRSRDAGLQIPAGSAGPGIRKDGGSVTPNLAVNAEAQPPGVVEEGIGMPDDVRK